MHIFGGLIGIAIGTLMIWKRYYLVTTFGTIDWAERAFSGGFGGTYFFYILAGFGVIFLSGLYMFGVIGAILSPVGGVFGGLAPKK